MTSRISRSAVAACVAIGLALSGCAGAEERSAPSSSSVVHVDSSWALAYPTIKEMAVAADGVALITVTGIEGFNFEDGAPFTDFRVKVDDWVASNGPTPGTILIHQMGGTDGTKVYVVEDDPILEVGGSPSSFSGNTRLASTSLWAGRPVVFLALALA